LIAVTRNWITQGSMIIRADDSSLFLVTQPDHAALAARIMRRWTAAGFPEPPRRDDVLAAIDAHDNGWREVDAAPRADCRMSPGVPATCGSPARKSWRKMRLVPVGSARRSVSFVT
jgi:hypothetical protein